MLEDGDKLESERGQILCINASLNEGLAGNGGGQGMGYIEGHIRPKFV